MANLLHVVKNNICVQPYIKEGIFMLKKNLLVVLLLAGAVGSTIEVGAASCSSSCNTTCATSCSSNCFTSNSCSSSCSNGSCCGCPCSGKTFFTNRPLYQTARPEYVSGFLNDKMRAAADGIGGSFEAVLFGGKATNTRKLASYFLPNCKQVLSVNEASSVTAPADLLATNFNIYTVNGTSGVGTPFESNICFNARASEFGLGLHYLQGFAFNCDKTAWWYVDISTPITHVNSELLLTESIVSNGGGIDAFASTCTVAANMTQAFNQDCWCFGKINSCASHGKTRLADIEAKLGYEWMYSDRCLFASYVGLVIPTGNKAKAEYVFEPIVGNGKHWGLMFGSQGGFNVWNSCNDNWHLEFSFYTNAEYLFRNTQMRSFDLKGKPWSRYIGLYANEAAATAAAALGSTVPGANVTPGINILTQHVKVFPRFQYNLTTMWTLSSDCGFQGEAGYNFYAREKECVKLACPWVTGPAIAAVTGDGETTPVRNITGNDFLNGVTQLNVPLSEYSESLIQASDLDLDSAAHPAMLSNTIYASLGYKWADMCTPVHMNIGGSYEWAGKDFAVMNRWTLWGKVGVSF